MLTNDRLSVGARQCEWVTCSRLYVPTKWRCRDSNLAPLGHEAGVITTTPTRLTKKFTKTTNLNKSPRWNHDSPGSPKREEATHRKIKKTNCITYRPITLSMNYLHQLHNTPMVYILFCIASLVWRHFLTAHRLGKPKPMRYRRSLHSQPTYGTQRHEHAYTSLARKTTVMLINSVLLIKT